MVHVHLSANSTTAVTAAAVIANDAVVRGDGGARGIQGSGITLDDSDNLTGVNSITLATALAVTSGGTGRASATAYAVICGGTTSTSAHQSVTSVGTSLQILRSNGASALPTFEDVDSCSLPIISGATYNTIGEYNIATSSSGVITGLNITDGGSGTLDIASGSMFIRSTASDVGDIFMADFAGSTGVALTDNSVNFIYIEYNSGTPAVSITTVPNATPQNFVILGVVYREGTTLHISPVYVPTSQVAQKLGRRLALIDGVTRQTGAVVGETGTRNMTTTAGILWLALTSYAVSAFDSSAADTWSYYYSDGAGGFTEVTGATQIDNTQYDDGSGSLATLGNNKYGAHWVYKGIDNDTYVVYGTGSYSLTDSQDAGSPASLPLQITSLHTAVLAKIIIQKSASSFTEIQSAFDTAFQTALASDHGDLSGLQGGTTDEYYHLTSAQHSALGGGIMVQQVYGSSVTAGTTTSTILLDDTIPQISEGTEVTTVSITPTSSSNILVIEACGPFTSTNQNAVVIALFQDATAAALSATSMEFENEETSSIYIQFRMVAGTESATTFRLRYGRSAAVGTACVNGDTGGRLLGGVAETWIKVTELTV